MDPTEPRGQLFESSGIAVGEDEPRRTGAPVRHPAPQPERQGEERHLEADRQPRPQVASAMSSARSGGSGISAVSATRALPEFPAGIRPASDPGPATTIRTSWPATSVRSHGRIASRSIATFRCRATLSWGAPGARLSTLGVA